MHQESFLSEKNLESSRLGIKNEKKTTKQWKTMEDGIHIVIVSNLERKVTYEG